jgi:23S rRNA (cytidine2498-2'-O)-methyltransferase
MTDGDGITKWIGIKQIGAGMQQTRVTAYLAPHGFVKQVAAELTGVQAVHGRLVIAQGPPQTSHWAQNIWLEPHAHRIRSITDGARTLRAIQRNWVMYSCRWHRRSKLIQEKLPHVSAKPLRFPDQAPTAPLGSWTLLAPDTLLASPSCSSAFPNGEVQFVECKHGSPSRAYLKLWEVFTLTQRMPSPGELCLDAGASPGGWTWVLHQLGARVLAVDRSELTPEIMRLPGVTYRRADAFSIRPGQDGPFNWIFWDVACYPEKLYQWLSLWLNSGKRCNFVITLKFQGNSSYGAINTFAALPHKALLHLSHNKHELTWISLA